MGKIQLSDHFTYGKLIRFTIPSMAMMVFTSVYGVVDGFFVSNFAGKTAFSAVNLIMPFIMIISTVGMMFGTGGTALVAKTLGEGDRERANRLFSLFVYVAAALGVAFSAAGLFLVRPVAAMLGAEGELLGDCVLYGRIVISALPFDVMQILFQSFFVTAEKPQLGFCATALSGVTNMALDAILVPFLPTRLKLCGAAIATAASLIVGGAIPLFYFSRDNDSLLRLGRTRFDGREVAKACANGSSELMSNISMNLVGMLYNVQLMRHAGEDGVAAYGVMMYVSMIFSGAFIGYSIGSSPVVGYHYGAGHSTELKGILRKSLAIIAGFSAAMFLFAELLARPLATLFVGYDGGLADLTVSGFRVYAVAFLLMGFAIFSSGFFTALGDGLTSALISFLRTLVFEVAAVIVLPIIFGIDGVWYSIVVAEVMAALLSAFFLVKKRGKFHY